MFTGATAAEPQEFIEALRKSRAFPHTDGQAQEEEERCPSERSPISNPKSQIRNPKSKLPVNSNSYLVTDASVKSTYAADTAGKTAWGFK